MRHTLVAPLEIKLAANDRVGEFEGYASVFNNTDSHGDKITPGAFKDTLTERKTQGRGFPPMHVMHGGGLFGGGDGVPVGIWTGIEEDSKGLAVTGKISGASNTEGGRLLYERVKDGALPGLSIGWSKRPGGTEYGKSAGEPKRTLKSVNLHEISLVADPSNPTAIVASVKASAQDAEKAASSVAAAMRMHDSVMKGGGSYYSGSAKNQALMMDHLRDAHEALTGSRSPDGLEGWTKSIDPEELEAGFVKMGLSVELAHRFAGEAVKAAAGGVIVGDDEDIRSLTEALSGFKLT